jgi:hypothetical protein
MRIEKFGDIDVEVTSFADIVGECETLEFRIVRPGGGKVDIAISQPDDQPGKLSLSVNGEVDADYAAWAVTYAKGWFRN